MFALDEGRIGVLLGDVSGHGRASLRHAALARYTLRTLLADGLPVGEALARADRLLARDVRPHFVTVIAALYDLEGGRLTYAEGRPPAADRSRRRLRPGRRGAGAAARPRGRGDLARVAYIGAVADSVGDDTAAIVLRRSGG